MPRRQGQRWRARVRDAALRSGSAASAARQQRPLRAGPRAPREGARLAVSGSDAGKSAGNARCSERRMLRGRRAYLASPPSPSSPSPSARASISPVSADTTPRSAGPCRRGGAAGLRAPTPQAPPSPPHADQGPLAAAELHAAHAPHHCALRPGARAMRTTLCSRATPCLLQAPPLASHAALQSWQEVIRLPSPAAQFALCRPVHSQGGLTASITCRNDC